MNTATKRAPVLSLATRLNRNKIALRILIIITLSFLLLPHHLVAQQLVSSTNRSRGNLVGSSSTAGRTVEELREQLNLLRRRKTLLQQILLSLNPASVDYEITVRHIQQLELRLNELSRNIDMRSAATTQTQRPNISANSHVGSAHVDNLISVPRLDTYSALATSNDVVPSSASSSAAQPSCSPSYPNPPAVLRARVVADASLAANDRRAGISPEVAADRILGGISRLMLYTIADALFPATDTRNDLNDLTVILNRQPADAQAIERQLTALRARATARAETQRTDRQTGASARSEGTTSAAERPSFADLLAFAIENGTVQREVSATTLTLSTSPYAFIAASQGDTATTYQNNEFFTRIGLSANFNLANQENPLASARRRQLAEWSARVRLTGDRSARSRGFEQFWNTAVRPILQQQPQAIINALQDSINQDAAFSTMFNNLDDALRDDLIAHLRADGTAPSEVGITNQVLCTLRRVVFDPVRNGTIVLSPIVRDAIARGIREAAAAVRAERGLDELIENELKRLNSLPVSTFAYTHTRQATGSDYSVLRLLYQQRFFSPMDFNANLGFSLYHRPDRTINQQSVRDFAAAISFVGGIARSPFLTDPLDNSQIMLSLTGRYQRMLEHRRVPGRRADIAAAQFRLEIPFYNGMSIPFAITYANATESGERQQMRANFGIVFDADKFFRLARARQAANAP